MSYLLFYRLIAYWLVFSSHIFIYVFLSTSIILCRADEAIYVIFIFNILLCLTSSTFPYFYFPKLFSVWLSYSFTLSLSSLLNFLANLCLCAKDILTGSLLWLHLLVWFPVSLYLYAIFLILSLRIYDNYFISVLSLDTI